MHDVMSVCDLKVTVDASERRPGRMSGCRAACFSFFSFFFYFSLWHRVKNVWHLIIPLAGASVIPVVCVCC